MKNISLLIIAMFIMSVFQVYTQMDDKQISDFLELKSTAEYKAIFLTTQGNFEVTAERSLSPNASDRFYQLIESKYFTNVPFYRVVPNFVAQFGTLDGKLDSSWSKHIIEDEPVLRSNDTGTIAFARAGKNTRGTQLYINLKNNARLDTVTYGETLGFPVFAKVTKGMDVVYRLFGGYGDSPRLILDTLKGDIPLYFKENYPKMDYIKEAYIIKNEE